MNGVSAGLLAVIAAVMYAASQVVFRRGLQGMALTAGMIVSLVFGLAVLLIASAIHGLQPIPPSALLWFVAAGLLAPGVGRLASIAANHRLGPSTSTPIQSSVGPMLAITGGLLLLGEQVDLKRVIAVAMIMIGVWDLAIRGHEFPGTTTIGNGATGTPDWSRRRRYGVILAGAAGLAYGASDLMRKQGLNMFPTPVMAATLTVATSFLVWLIFAASSREIRSNLHVGPGTGWFALGGVFTAFAQLAQFSALSAGDVSIVNPIVNAQPLAVIALSALLLRQLEKLSIRHLRAAALIVAGTVLLSGTDH
ncbi:MAG: EamA family transporter [Anaerolineales bacterium]